ncbi:nucleoside triphosphate pyrophosphohydrolase [Candidatus Sumerlaeota bacterium]|nr:nucleoside triphosphate pyrophosphohydrolase [Candidatus Sumerlaeales bacterium]NLD61501.1 nucleoside triphosphate pyrophosphohydrolase [Candidatus Sumerlaeota bacterium]
MKNGTPQEAFKRFVEIMTRLQAPDGCPWDREQTHESLRPYMIEEAYEAVDAIDRGDMKDLCEELGDVLLQVVFHAVMAEKAGEFTVDDVINGVSDKMVSRHPHVFGDVVANTSDKVLKNWEQIKQKEREAKAKDDPELVALHRNALSGIPANLPALLQAQRMQEKAARVGFDWDNTAQSLDKIEEEIGEMREALARGEELHTREEYGDLMFAMADLGRLMNIDAEMATRSTCSKFKRRFEYVENGAHNQGRELKDMTLEEMDVLWCEAKDIERSKTK